MSEPQAWICTAKKVKYVAGQQLFVIPNSLIAFDITIVHISIYTMVIFEEKSAISYLKIPHFHVSSVDFVDCLFVYNMWGRKGNMRLRDFYRAGCEFEKRREVRGTKLG